MAKIEELIAQIVEPIIEKNGHELVDVEYIKEGQELFLRIFIDKDDGVTLDDCELISKAVEKILDAEDPINQAYHLEISSPGLERPLKKTKDFEKFLKSTIEVKTFSPIDGRKKFKGRLEEVNNDLITIITTNGEIVIPRDKISKAKTTWEEK